MVSRDRRTPRGSPRSRGFTLIEVLMALTIFLVGMTGLLALMSSALAMHRSGLAAGSASRHVDLAAERVGAEVSAGGHWDDDAGGWVDVPPTELAEGVFYSVRFVPRDDGETVLAFVAAGPDAASLSAARPVPYLLSATPDAGRAVQAWRARSSRRAADRD